LLVSQGYRLAAANYRCRQGEIDLVAWDGPTLVFVEVKARRGNSLGGPAEAIGPRKLNRMRAVAAHYLSRELPGGDPPCRFDAVLVEAGRGPVTPGGAMILVRGVF
jgi:putative endonuclease